jgi:sugar lactone lactonase YvrE
MGWSPDRKTMYWTCSSRNTIFAYDFDPASGTMSRERIFHHVDDRKTFGTCDGLTVDQHGTVYSARWDGKAIYTFKPDGTAAGKIELPVPKVTSMCFGGKGLTDLYITTAGRNDGTAGAGGLYRIRLGVKGQLDFRSSLRQ